MLVNVAQLTERFLPTPVISNPKPVNSNVHLLFTYVESKKRTDIHKEKDPGMALTEKGNYDKVAPAGPSISQIGQGMDHFSIWR